MAKLKKCLVIVEELHFNSSRHLCISCKANVTYLHSLEM